MIRYPWKTAAAPRLALDLSSTAVRLMGRTAAGAWVELGAAPLAGGDFSKRIDELRVEALVRGPGPVPVDIWLPADQVLVRRYVLPRGAAGHAEALRRLAAEVDCAPRALSVAVSPAPAGTAATVLAVAARTAAEAREYAGRWGFLPGRVSTRVEAERFGADGPCFGPPAGPVRQALGASLGWALGTRAWQALGGTARDATRAGARPAAAAALTLLVGVATWGLWPADTPAPGIVTGTGTGIGTGPSLILASVDATAPGLSSAPFSAVARRDAQPLPVRHPREARRTTTVVDAAASGAPTVGPAPELAAPSTGVPMNVGPAPALPQHLRPGRLERLPSGSHRTDIGALLAGIERIRETVREHAAMPAGQPALIASASAVTIDRSAEAEIRLAVADTAAPRSVPLVPPPRPEGAVVPETGADLGADAGAEVGAEPGAEVAAEAPPGSDLAAVAAPRPPGKPARKAGTVRTAAARALVGGKPSPARVRDAALKHGLTLDSTSLIGVLDASAGRQALLRLAGGDYLKVGRGDTVEGWRVSTINREAVRLTRGSQSRTLLLVAH